MAFVIVPNCVKLSVEGTVGGQLIVMTLGFCRGTPPTPTEQIALNNNVHSWWTTDMTPLMSNAFLLEKIENTDLSSSSGPVETLVVSPAEPGSSASPPVQNNVAQVVSFLTPNRGRSYRGRVYVGGWPVAGLADSVSITTAFQGSLIGAFVNLSLAVAVGLWQHVVISRVSGHAPRPTGISTQITGYACDIFTDSQRRRLAGRGI